MKNKNLNYVQDPFAEVEEDIELFFSQERKEKIKKKFLGKLSKASLLVLVLKLKTRETFLFTCGSNIYSPQEIGWVYALIPSLQAIISQVWCRLPREIAGSESKSIEWLILENLASGKGKNYSPLKLIPEKKKSFMIEIKSPNFLDKDKDFPLTHYNPEGQSFSLIFVAVAMEIMEITERLNDPSISAEEREYLEAILMRLLLIFPFLFPFWFVRKLMDFHSPYPYLTAAILLSYLFYKNKEKLLPLFSKIYRVGKQVALIPNKEVVNILTDSDKQLVRVLTTFEKQLAIVLDILEKQVELVPDKNKQLVLVLNILAKQLELVADKKKQVAIVLGILAKQLVLRATDLPLPLVVEPHLATGTDLILYNDTPLKGEDHF